MPCHRKKRKRKNPLTHKPLKQDLNHMNKMLGNTTKAVVGVATVSLAIHAATRLKK